MAKPFSSIPPRSKAAWIKLGNKAVGMIKEWTINQGKDVYGKSFPKYSAKYAFMKKEGKFPRQGSKSTKPDFFLTGDTMGDLKVKKANSNSVTIGWTSFGHIIEGQAEKGRAVTSDKQPVAEHIIKFIENDYLAQMAANISKVRERATFRIG